MRVIGINTGDCRPDHDRLCEFACNAGIEDQYITPEQALATACAHAFSATTATSTTAYTSEPKSLKEALKRSLLIDYQSP